MKRTRNKNYFWSLAIWPAIFILCSPNLKLLAQHTISKAYQVKALFLYNFTQFVEWPPKSFPAPEAPLIIGVLGEDPYGTFIDDLIQGEVIANRPLIIERYTSADEAGNCHILYINMEDNQHVRQALKTLGSRAILTVSDDPNFTKMGGMIRFMNDRGKIRIQINIDAVTEANLVISSKLLRLSDIYSEN